MEFIDNEWRYSMLVAKLHFWYLTYSKTIILWSLMGFQFRMVYPSSLTDSRHLSGLQKVWIDPHKCHFFLLSFLSSHVSFPVPDSSPTPIAIIWIYWSVVVSFVTLVIKGAENIMITQINTLLYVEIDRRWAMDADIQLYIPHSHSVKKIKVGWEESQNYSKYI